MKKISEEEIKEIENWMNNYPRKRLGYKSPKEVVEECLQNNDNFGIPLEFVAV